MPRFYTNNNTYPLANIGSQSVFKYTNETKRRLYVNKFDLLPDVYFAKYGTLKIKKNGIVEYDSVSDEQETNDLRRYLQYSVSDRVRSLDREDRLEVILTLDHANTTIKLGLSLELGFENEPIPATNIARDLLSLNFISDILVLADNVTYDQTATEHHNLPFDILGHNKILITIQAHSVFDPTLLTNEILSLPLTWINFIANSYRGNTSALTKSGSVPGSTPNPYTYYSGTILWTYADPNAWEFREADGTIFDPISLSSNYAALSAVWDLNNPDKENRTYAIAFAAPLIFAFDVRYEYITSIYSRLARGNSNTPDGISYFRYIWQGKRIYATQIQTIQILGYDNPDQSDNPVTLETIADAPHTELMRNIATNKKYLRLLCNVDYNITVADINEIVEDGINAFTAGIYPGVPATDPYLGLGAFYNSLPAQGQIYPAYPNRRLGYLDPAFPATTPLRMHNFQQTVANTLPALNDFDIASFIRTPAQPNTVMLSLQTKGANGEWFTLIEDIGAIKANGKTVLTLSSDDFERNVTFVRAPDAMRLVVTTQQSISLSITVALTN